MFARYIITPLLLNYHNRDILKLEGKFKGSLIEIMLLILVGRRATVLLSFKSLRDILKLKAKFKGSLVYIMFLIFEGRRATV